MKTRRLSNQDDWTFGKSASDYLVRSAAIQQNLVTRLRSFSNDWFLDLDANIDWIFLLSNRNTQKQIEREVERVTLSTEGVAVIDKLRINVDRESRHATIELNVTDIYGEKFLDNLGVTMYVEPEKQVYTLALVSGDDLELITGDMLELTGV